MISGFAQNGRCRQALNLFHEMQRAHWGGGSTHVNEAVPFKGKPLQVSLNNALVHIYSSCGAVDKAYRVFKSMSWRTTISWTSMIMGFAKQSRGKEVLDVFQWMLRVAIDEVRPDEITFDGVLCACSHARYVIEVRHYFNSMNEKWRNEPTIEHYECMVDLLSRAGYLDEAFELVELMRMKPNEAANEAKH
ncbi:Pentatricopeptide repeat, partial [Dillenia turbinata]